MATVADLNAALTCAANHLGDGRTIGAGAQARIKAWFEARHAETLGGESMTADDLSQYLGDIIKEQVLRYERQEDIRALPGPPPLDEGGE